MKALDAAKQRFAAARTRHPWLDRAVRMQEHYTRINGSQLAGSVTYFGFLSVFPILALAFFAVGWIAMVYPNAQTDLIKAIDSVLPGLVGSGTGQVSLSSVQHAAGAVGAIGLVGVAYAGLGWLDALRQALVAAFELRAADRPSWLVGKARDALTLIALGVILGVSVALVGFLSPWLSAPLGLVTDGVLLYAIFRLLAAPGVSLLGACILGAVGFEALKQLSRLLLGLTQGSPAFQVFGVSLILLVWINYFSRLLLYAASFAATGGPAAPHAKHVA